MDIQMPQMDGYEAQILSNYCLKLNLKFILLKTLSRTHEIICSDDDDFN
jgi:CheY-like chemotaxis protein